MFCSPFLIKRVQKEIYHFPEARGLSPLYLFMQILLQCDDDATKPVSFGSLVKLSSPEWKYLLIGCFGSVLYGSFPFLYGKAYGGLFDVRVTRSC